MKITTMPNDPVGTGKLSTFSYCFDSRTLPKNCHQSANRQRLEWI